MTQPTFIAAAKVETFLRDRDALRKAIRAHDSEATEAAWDRFERWTDCINPNGKGDER